MGKKWDYDVPGVEVWRECYRVIKPGGHLLAFFGSRTYHRGCIPIEDAGFEIRDQIMWVYGSGFPKSHNISKALDKKAGAERKVVGVANGAGNSGSGTYGWNTPSKVAEFYEGGWKSTYNVTEAASDEAKQWEGWGTALKPAHEPIVVARKHIEGTIADNVLQFGTGGINIDGTRINERFPANFIHGGIDEEWAPYFYCPKASAADRDEGLEFLQARQKPGVNGESYMGMTSEGRKQKAKNIHPTVKPTELMRYLCRLVTPPGGTVLDPFTGSGSTLKAAHLEDLNYIGIEREAEYVEIAKARIPRQQMFA